MLSLTNRFNITMEMLSEFYGEFYGVHLVVLIH